MRFDEKKMGLLALIAYIVAFFFLAVINRDSGTSSTVKSDLFWGYNNPPKDIYRDNILNFVGFIPVGALVGLIAKKHGIAKPFIAGLLVSLLIECSQLIWHRGTFDVDDLFNNALGAFVGGMMIDLVWSRKRNNVN